MSDHYYVDRSFKEILRNRDQFGPGYWKCNTSVLSDPALYKDIEKVFTILKSDPPSLKTVNGGKNVNKLLEKQLYPIVVANPMILNVKYCAYKRLYDILYYLPILIPTSLLDMFFKLNNLMILLFKSLMDPSSDLEFSL